MFANIPKYFEAAIFVEVANELLDTQLELMAIEFIEKAIADALNQNDYYMKNDKYQFHPNEWFVPLAE